MLADANMAADAGTANDGVADAPTAPDGTPWDDASMWHLRPGPKQDAGLAAGSPSGRTTVSGNGDERATKET